MRTSPATKLVSEAGRVWGPEPRQDRKETVLESPRSRTGSPLLSEPGGLVEPGAQILGHPKLKPEIDLKGASHFVLIERRIFVCSLMDFIGGGWEGKRQDPSKAWEGGRPGMAQRGLKCSLSPDTV